MRTADHVLPVFILLLAVSASCAVAVIVNEPSVDSPLSGTAPESLVPVPVPTQSPHHSKPHRPPSNVNLIPINEQRLSCTVFETEEIFCSDNATYVLQSRDEAGGFYFWLHLGTVLGLVLFAGLMSGLTMGLMSLDTLNLEVLVKSGTSKQKAHAARILPLVQRHHLLLVTLLLSNAAAMETLPIFLNKVVPEWIAIIVSVTLVLFVGEVIPQAVCTRYGLAIGANLFWLVWGLIFLTFPISWPISKLLDAIIGSSHTHLFRRNELKALVSLHQLKSKDIQRPNGGHGPSSSSIAQDPMEGLSEDEVKIIKGALELKEKKVEDAYCPLEDVFMLEFSTTLDKKLINTILKEGHSRIPVYRKTRHHVIGVLLLKTILKKSAGSSEPVPISKLELRAVPSVTTDKPLFEMLHLFRTGRSHLAIVLDSKDSVTCAGIITLEDVVEELIQMEIWDEEDIEKLETTKTPAKKAIDINRYYNEKTPLIEQYGFSV